MSEHAPRVFSGIAPDRFAALCEKAKAAGIDLDGNSGTASKYGVEVRWDYDPATCQLVLECLKTPFFVSADDVYGRLNTLVQQSLA